MIYHIRLTGTLEYHPHLVHNDVYGLSSAIMGSIYIKHSVAVDMDVTFIHAPQILHLDVCIII